MTYAELLTSREWKPLRNCPGRFVLRSSRTDLTVADLLGEAVETMEYHVETAADEVLVVKLDSGGLISYKRFDGSLVHTLNAPEGFARKLEQLGIHLPQ